VIAPAVLPIRNLDPRSYATYIGKPIDCRQGVSFGATPAADSADALFLRSLGFSQIFFLKQVHGATIVAAEVLRSGAVPEADGIFIKKQSLTECPGIAFGIRTADCLPIYIETQSSILLLHGGWRSIAAGICAEALRLIPNERIEQLVIGPAACGSCYEVGQEVIDALHAPVYQARTDTPTFSLDLPQTVLQFFRTHTQVVELGAFPVCTITETAWHSHRREKDARGSNLLLCGNPLRSK
jgi:hypothetical protein